MAIQGKAANPILSTEVGVLIPSPSLDKAASAKITENANLADRPMFNFVASRRNPIPPHASADNISSLAAQPEDIPSFNMGSSRIIVPGGDQTIGST